MSAAVDPLRRSVEAPAIERVPIGAAPDALVDELARLEHAVEQRPWSHGSLRDEFARPDRTWLVARDLDGLAGFAGSVRLGDDVHVLRLTVAPDRRRRGLGRSLLDGLVRDAQEQGAASLTLEVRADNDAARALYAAAGLTERGRRAGYYPDGQDALLLTLDLEPGEGD